RELYRDAGVVLGRGIAIQEERRLPALVLHPCVHFNVFAQALYSVHREVVLRSAHRDEILGCFRVAILELQPLVAAEVIGEPRLTTLRFPADPIGEDEAFIGVCLLLDCLPVHKAAAEAAPCRRVSGDSFCAQGQLGRTGKVRKIEPRPDSRAARSTERRYIVMGFGIAVKRKPVTHKWDAIGEIECRKPGARIVAANLLVKSGVVDVKETLEVGVPRDGLVTLATKDDGALEAKLEVGSRLEAETLRMGVIGVRCSMPLQASV